MKQFFNIRNIFKVFIIFSFGLISRVLVNFYFNLNVFMDYNHYISIFYYFSLSIFIVFINYIFDLLPSHGFSFGYFYEGVFTPIISLVFRWFKLVKFLFCSIHMKLYMGDVVNGYQDPSCLSDIKKTIMFMEGDSKDKGKVRQSHNSIDKGKTREMDNSKDLPNPDSFKQRQNNNLKQRGVFGRSFPSKNDGNINPAYLHDKIPEKHELANKKGYDNLRNVYNNSVSEETSNIKPIDHPTATENLQPDVSNPYHYFNDNSNTNTKNKSHRKFKRKLF